MRIFTYGETPPQTPDQSEQESLIFNADLPFINVPSMSAEILAKKDKFPLVEDFELVIIDGRQSESFGSDIMAQFVDRSKNLRITYWDMYSIDSHPMDMNRIPNPKQGEFIAETEMGYHVLITVDEDFVYVAYGEDEDYKAFTHYCKIPKAQYESEWKAFIEWYHEHPEKRRPGSPSTAQTMQSAESPDTPIKKQGSWLSRLFK